MLIQNDIKYADAVAILVERSTSTTEICPSDTVISNFLL